MKNRKLKRILFGLVSLCIISALFLTFVVVLGMVESASVKRLGDKLQRMNEKNKILQGLREIHQQWMNIGTTYREIKERHFFGFEDLTDIRRDMTNLIQGSFAKILKQKDDIINIRNEFAMVKTQLIFEGNYRKVKEFIFNLQSKKKMVVFRSILLKKKENTCYGELEMEVYFVR